ncbi:MAG: hypothetical protein PHN55_11735, partial [Dysgonamonadaceae bacterium]|nr:hypothetical protein [Dysgonamonadaceae bacterium]
ALYIRVFANFLLEQPKNSVKSSIVFTSGVSTKQQHSSMGDFSSEFSAMHSAFSTFAANPQLSQ